MGPVPAEMSIGRDSNICDDEANLVLASLCRWSLVRIGASFALARRMAASCTGFNAPKCLGPEALATTGTYSTSGRRFFLSFKSVQDKDSRWRTASTYDDILLDLTA
jgi:hypothetical protein